MRLGYLALCGRRGGCRAALLSTVLLRRLLSINLWIWALQVVASAAWSHDPSCNPISELAKQYFSHIRP